MWDLEIHIHMSSELFVRIRVVGMSCYAYWTIGEFMSWQTYEWWIYDMINFYGVEIGEWICNDIWYWFEWSYHACIDEWPCMWVGT